MYVGKFEKVSKRQYLDDLNKLVSYTEDGYEDIILPKRATVSSAGYDFVCPVDILLMPQEMVKIPTGIRCKMLDGYVLEIYPRSSFGFKHQMTLLNTVGIIDADYYGADNEGHIIIAIKNNSDHDLHITKGERFAQGVFLAYYLAEEEAVDTKRTGGFGSSDMRP